MTVIKKIETKSNPWVDRKFRVIKHTYFTQGDKILSYSDNIMGPELVFEDQTQFNLKLNELRLKNEAIKSMAVQEKREFYTQNILVEL